MKKTIATLLIMSIAFGTYAYNEADLQKLIQTNSCPGGDLQKARLIEADLSGANLERANLSGANLERANLERARLIEANLYFANLYSANLAAADLSGANIKGASFSNTVMPDGQKYTGRGEDYHGPLAPPRQ